MCVCITKSCAFGSGFAKRSSWQGAPAARSPLHPLRPNGASRSPIQPDNGSDRIGAFQRHRGDFGSPRQAYGRMPSPIDKGACLTPLNPAASSAAKEHFIAPLDPIDHFMENQPSADWMPPRDRPSMRPKGLTPPLWTPANSFIVGYCLQHVGALCG